MIIEAEARPYLRNLALRGLGCRDLSGDGTAVGLPQSAESAWPGRPYALRGQPRHEHATHSSSGQAGTLSSSCSVSKDSVADALDGSSTFRAPMRCQTSRRRAVRPIANRAHDGLELAPGRERRRRDASEIVDGFERRDRGSDVRDPIVLADEMPRLGVLDETRSEAGDDVDRVRVVHFRDIVPSDRIVGTSI